MAQFVLRNVSWIALNRWNSLTAKQKRGFAPINPDFEREIRGT